MTKAKSIVVEHLLVEDPNDACYKFDYKKKIEYLKDILNNGTGRVQAALNVGVAPTTVDREIAKGNGLQQARDVVEESATDKVENALYKAAVGGDVQAMKEWLRVKRKDIWGKTTPTIGISIAAQITVVPGEIDWDAIPWELAERFIAIHDELVALQPASGGLIINQEGGNVNGGG